MSAHPRSLMPPSFFPLHPYCLQTSAHPRSLMPTGPSPHPFPTSLAPVPSAHVRASTLAHAHRSFSLPICNLSLHPHRPHTSAHPRALMLTGPSPHPFPILPFTHTVRTRSRIHARSCPPALLPAHFQLFPCTQTVGTLLRIHAHAAPFPHPFHLSLAPAPSAKNVRASTLAHAHGSFSPIISNVPSTHTLRTHPRMHARAHRSFLPTHFQPFPCTHTIRTPSCPPVLLPTPSAHVRPSTLAHTHRSFSLPISNFCVAPALSAHIRAHRPFSPPISNLPLHPKHTPLDCTVWKWHRQHYVSGARQLCFEAASSRKVFVFSCQTWQPAL